MSIISRKKAVVLICVLFACAVGLFAQQITNFGVVDTARVYTTYFRESSAVRNYEAKKSEFQAEIDKKTAELKNLQQKKIDYEQNGNEAAALKVQADINKKSDYLSAYTGTKNAELEKLRQNLATSNSFYQLLYKAIGRIAESEGYSMILSLQQANGILWYSPTVDITEKVIAELGSR